jgi:hypothetical protein
LSKKKKPVLSERKIESNVECFMVDGQRLHEAEIKDYFGLELRRNFVVIWFEDISETAMDFEYLDEIYYSLS